MSSIGSLTYSQRQWLGRIQACQTVIMRKVEEGNPGCKASPWISVHTLNIVHKVPMNVINQLVKKGYLDEQPSDGFGKYVKPTNT
jgi:hypothetical protein